MNRYEQSVEDAAAAYAAGVAANAAIWYGAAYVVIPAVVAGGGATAGLAAASVVPVLGTAVVVGAAVVGGAMALNDWINGPSVSEEEFCARTQAGINAGIITVEYAKAIDTFGDCQFTPMPVPPVPNPPLFGFDLDDTNVQGLADTNTTSLAFVRAHADTIPQTLDASGLNYYADYVGLGVTAKTFYGAMQRLKGVQPYVNFDANGRALAPSKIEDLLAISRGFYTVKKLAPPSAPAPVVQSSGPATVTPGLLAKASPTTVVVGIGVAGLVGWAVVKYLVPRMMKG